MDTTELTGAALDWAVAKCEGIQGLVKRGNSLHYPPGQFSDEEAYTPSTDWAQGGPIIEREKMVLGYLSGLACASTFEGNRHQRMEFGTTPLIAAMRCYVASKLGDEVDVPEELK